MEIMKSCWMWALVSVVLALLAVVRAGQLSEENSDMLHLAPDIYNEGPLKVELFTVASDGFSSRHSIREWRKSKGFTVHKIPALPKVKVSNSPPRSLLIAAPQESGEYPVIVFHHGYSLKNQFYSQLMSHVASHGFIAVAPQMYVFSGSDTTEEIFEAGVIIDWFAAGLAAALEKRVASVKPNLEKIAIVGHSRGGKVVFGLAKGGVYKISLKLSAIAGLDPVDGLGIDQQTNPPILQFSQFALQLDIPTLIVGSGYGPQRKNLLFPACAPEGVSHEAFFYESSPPSFHFVATEHGHMDFLNDYTGGVQGLLSYYICKNGQSREPMRRFSAGILVAFLQASLLKDDSQLSTAFSNPDLAPVKLEKPESFGSLSNLFAAKNTTASSLLIAA